MRSWRQAYRRESGAPQNVDSALHGALLAVLEHDLERGEALLTAAVRLDSTAVEPYLALGRLYRMRGEIGRAIRIHQNLLLRPDLDGDQSIAALADLAADYRRGGFLQRAIAAYEEVLSRKPRHLAALAALAPLLASVRNYPRAIEMARKLSKQKGDDPSKRESALLVELAEYAHGEGRSTEARRAVKRALRRNASSLRGWLLLGELEVERGSSKAALTAWSKIPEIDRRSGPLVYARLESTYAALDRPRDFEAYLSRLLDEKPDDVRARMALAHAFAARGNAEEAIAELERVRREEPGNLEARAALGRLLLAERRSEHALREYAELLDALAAQGLLREREKLL
jgi:lipopolysaccharide assembly protein B